LLQVVKTYAYQSDGSAEGDKLEGTMVVELQSPDKRYKLITDAESFATLKPAPENTAGFKGAC
jgi:hypothetical protein